MENEEPSNYDYFSGKRPDKTYISKRLMNRLPDGERRDIRIVSKVIDSRRFFTHEKIAKQTVLRETFGGRQQIVAKLYEDTKDIFVLSLQKYSLKNDKPHELSFSFVGKEIEILKDFINSIGILDLSEPVKGRVEDEQLKRIKELVMDEHGLELLIEMAEKNVTKRDIIALGYRKEQLEIFFQLISNNTYFEQEKTAQKKTRDEDVWQNFFERNPWIFGYGLNLIFHDPLQGKKLEQVVSGFDITGSGKRVDGLLKTRGIINSLCLVETKTHRTNLLKKICEAYRPDCWQVSDELNGGIAQLQKTSQKTIENVGTKLNPRSTDASPTGEEIYLYHPRSYLVIGSLSEFETEHGINPEKYSSFELFRRSISGPEIITFDELYERAKFIVYNSEQSSHEKAG